MNVCEYGHAPSDTPRRVRVCVLVRVPACLRARARARACVLVRVPVPACLLVPACSCLPAPSNETVLDPVLEHCLPALDFLLRLFDK